jgi:PAS domain S-box-containing protein
MYSKQTDQVLIFLVNFEGQLLEVLFDSKNFLQETEGDIAKSSLFNLDSSQKFIKLLMEIVEKNYAFNKDLEIRKGKEIYALHFGGFILKEKILIIGFSSDHALDAEYIKDIMNIVSEQVSKIREKTKENIAIFNRKASNEKYYEKFSELNNELVNLQRKLTKKNLLLEKTSTNLRKANQELELFIETVPNGILVIRLDGHIQLINKKFKEYYSKEINRDLKVNDNIEGRSDDSILLTYLKELIQNPREKTYEIEIQPEKLWIKLTSKLMFLKEDDKPYGLLIELHDITDHIRFNNMRNQLISFISHELRNPLSTINLSLETYKSFGKNLSPQKIDELFGYIDKNVDLLKKIVNDFDLFSRAELEKIELKFTHTNLNNLLEQAISELQPRLDKKNIQIQKNFPETNTSLCCDKHRIDQIIRILLDNAIKYSDGNSRVQIQIINNYNGSYNPYDEEGYLIRIKDQGIGIKKEDLVNIFEPFYRGENTKHEKGSGLGLTLAKKLIKLHNGDIYIESVYEKGTTSIIFIPKNLEKCLEKKKEK